MIANADEISKLKRIRTRGPLAGKAYDNLKSAIIQGRLTPGTWLHEEKITKALGISRTPLREALNRLSSDGLIEVIPRKGAHIVELNDYQLKELFEAREKIETIFFIRAAQAIEPSVLKQIRLELESAEKDMLAAKGDAQTWDRQRQRYLKNDRSFHDILISATGNRYWEKLYNNIRDRIELYANQISGDNFWFPIAIQDHYEIIDEVLQGRFEAGRDRMKRHIRNARAGIVAIRRAQQGTIPQQPD
jgi:DNA-binding GntR family transcriptional regulator